MCLPPSPQPVGAGHDAVAVELNFAGMAVAPLGRRSQFNTLVSNRVSTRYALHAQCVARTGRARRENLPPKATDTSFGSDLSPSVESSGQATSLGHQPRIDFRPSRTRSTALHPTLGANLAQQPAPQCISSLLSLQAAPILDHNDT